MITRLLSALVITLSLPVYAAAQPAVFLVRHAERADTAPGAAPPMAAPRGTAPAADPDLSDAGRARATSLAAALRDANITAIFATDLKRTQQTAAPLAHALGLTVIILPAASTEALVARLKALSGNALVVGHSDTVPAIIKALGVKTPAAIPDTEFDNLFIVTRASKPPSLARLHYR